MSLQRMEHAVSAAHLNEGDARWFPKWLSRCSQWTHQPPEETIEVNASRLIRFLQTWRNSGKPAFVRLLVVQALELYQQIRDPDHSSERITVELTEIRHTLGRPVQDNRDRRTGQTTAAKSTNPDVTDDAMRIGRMDPKKCRSLNRCEADASTALCATYGTRASRQGRTFFSGIWGPDIVSQPDESGGKEFLSGLAVHERVAASTQNRRSTG